MEDKQSHHSESQFSRGQLVLDLYAKAVTIAGEPVAITPLEFNLLVYLARHPMRPVPGEELLEAIWDCQYGTTNQVTCCVKRLRKKLAVEGVPQYLHTQRGFGFRLCEPHKLPPRRKGG